MITCETLDCSTSRSTGSPSNRISTAGSIEVMIFGGSFFSPLTPSRSARASSRLVRIASISTVSGISLSASSIASASAEASASDIPVTLIFRMCAVSTVAIRSSLSMLSCASYQSAPKIGSVLPAGISEIAARPSVTFPVSDSGWGW